VKKLKPPAGMNPPALAMRRRGAKGTPPHPSDMPIDKLPRFALSAFAFAVTGQISKLFPRWVNQHIEGDWGVRGPGLHFIGLISRVGQMTMSEAAEALQLTPSGVTRIVKQLEQEGLVSRTENSDDRRQSYVTLTPSAKKKAKTLLPMHDALIASATSSLTDDELRTYLKVALKLSAALGDETKQ
jgi:DNA-binding MarR family transcriptional regulator